MRIAHCGLTVFIKTQNDKDSGPWYQTLPDRLRNVSPVTGTCTSGHKRDFEVTVIVLPAAMLLQENVSFLSLIGSRNSPGGVPQRTHMSRKVVGDTLNLKDKSQ